MARWQGGRGRGRGGRADGGAQGGRGRGRGRGRSQGRGKKAKVSDGPKPERVQAAYRPMGSQLTIEEVSRRSRGGSGSCNTSVHV